MHCWSPMRCLATYGIPGLESFWLHWCIRGAHTSAHVLCILLVRPVQSTHLHAFEEVSTRTSALLTGLFHLAQLVQLCTALHSRMSHDAVRFGLGAMRICALQFVPMHFLTCRHCLWSEIITSTMHGCLLHTQYCACVIG